MHHRPFDAEQVGVKVLVANAVSNLSGQAGIELVLGDRLEHLPALVGGGGLDVQCHVDGLGGDGDFVNAFPRPSEIGPSRRDDANLRVGVTVAFLGSDALGDGIIEDGPVRDAVGAPKDGLHRTFVLVHGVNASHQVAQEKPRHQAQECSNEKCHYCLPFRRPPKSSIWGSRMNS